LPATVELDGYGARAGFAFAAKVWGCRPNLTVSCSRTKGKSRVSSPFGGEGWTACRSCSAPGRPPGRPDRTPAEPKPGSSGAKPLHSGVFRHGETNSTRRLTRGARLRYPRSRCRTTGAEPAQLPSRAGDAGPRRLQAILADRGTHVTTRSTGAHKSRPGHEPERRLGAGREDDWMGVASGRVALAKGQRDAAHVRQRTSSNLAFSWTRHPAPFARSVLETAVEILDLPRGAGVIDPFCGTATAGTYLVGRGERFYGIEAHPLTARIAAAKFARPGPPDGLRGAADAVSEAAASATPGPHLLGEPDLLLRAIDIEVLSKLVAMRDTLFARADPWEDQLLVALLGALRDCAASGWPAPDIGRSRKRPPSPTEALIRRADRMADDIAAAPREPIAHVTRGDSRTSDAWSEVEAGTIDGCITSRPYMNQVSYAEASRLELFFLGLARDWRGMTTLLHPDLLAACTQQVSVRQAKSARTAALLRTPATAAALRLLTEQLVWKQRDRTRGKPYDSLVWTYWVDMADVLSQLLRVLAPGARAVWLIGDSAPYGVHIDAPQILALLATELGFEALEDRPVRERGGRWPGVGERHSRRLEERLIVLRRPHWANQESLPGLSEIS
jgi:hypothetical protein